MNTYLVLKLLHVTAVIVFLGNIYTGLFWVAQANKTKNQSIIHFAFKSLILSDKYFTMPGVLVIIVFGVMASYKGGFPLLSTGWVIWSIVLFSISGIAFGLKLVPLQKRICDMTGQSNSSGKEFDWKEYHRQLKAWELWGLVSIGTPIIALVMMVMKWPA